VFPDGFNDCAGAAPGSAGVAGGADTVVAGACIGPAARPGPDRPPADRTLIAAIKNV